MIKTTYQTPELRNANDEVVQEGAFGKNTALSNSTNDGWIDYVMNDLEALHDTIGDSAPTLDGNGHVVEPANLAIGDEDGVRLKTGYLKTSGGTVSGTLNVAQNLKMQDNQENVFGGFYVPASSATEQYFRLYGGSSNSATGAKISLMPEGNGRFYIIGNDSTGGNQYILTHTDDGILTWRGNRLAYIASPAFTGTPTAPTQATNNNSTRLATTAYVVNDLKANVPLLADTLAETIPSGADLNDYNTQGTYRSTSGSITDSLSNCPVTGIAFKLIVFQCGYNSILYGIQILMTSLERIYVRSSSSTVGSWRPWKQIAYAENVLPLSGGTMTGTINSTSPSFGSVTFDDEDITSGIQRNHTNYMLYWKDGNNASVCGVFAAMRTGGTVSLDFTVKRVGTTTTKSAGLFVDSSSASFRASSDNDITLGISSLRWKQLYAGTTTIATSDERLKDNIVAIPDAVLDAWGEVNWYQYQFKDSIAEKGETKARIHTGAIAQRIESIFASHGLDANKYGLLCYDAWDAEPAERDEDGNIIQEARPAGDRYSLRYEEALCMEAAYQRRRADRLEARIEALERAMNNAL